MIPDSELMERFKNLAELYDNGYNNGINDAIAEAIKFHTEWFIPDTSNINHTPYTKLISKLEALKKKQQ